jgi:YceI-like domain
VIAHRVGQAVVAAACALLQACTSQPPVLPEVAKGGPPEFPHAYYAQLAAAGKPTFRVDAERSLIVIDVRRAGSLARLGHDHVVASHDAAGYIAPGEGRADIYVPLDTLAVDEPQLRAEFGLDTQPDADDIAGTRSNMLRKVLDADRYPYALINVNELGSGQRGPIRVAVTLHGVTNSVEAGAQWIATAEELSVTGDFALDQSAFGITPFSLLGGALAVADRVTLTFRIRARRMNPARDAP